MLPDDASDDLSAYLDGELGADDTARVQRALERDPDLRIQLRELKKVRDLLGRHGRVEAPIGLAARVLEAVANEPAPRLSWWSRWRRPFGVPLEAFAVAAAALLVVVVVTARPPPGDGSVVGDFEAPSTRSEQMRLPPDRHAARAQVALPSANELSVPIEGTPLEDALSPEASVRTALALRGAGLPDGGDADERPLSTVAATEPVRDAVADSSVLEGGDAQEQQHSPALFGASYRYRVRTSEPDAVARLLRLVAHFEGRVLDGDGRAVTQAHPIDGSTSFRVVVAASSLADFGASLRALGLVDELPDPRIFASSDVTVQVDLVASSASAGTADDAGDASALRTQP